MQDWTSEDSYRERKSDKPDVPHMPFIYQHNVKVSALIACPKVSKLRTSEQKNKNNIKIKP